MIEYKLLKSYELDSFNEYVNKYLSAGWELYKAPAIVVVGTHALFYQAIFKETLDES